MNTSWFIAARTIRRAIARARPRARCRPGPGLRRPRGRAGTAAPRCRAPRRTRRPDGPARRRRPAPVRTRPRRSAKPRARTSPSSRSSAAGSTIVRSVRRSRPACGGVAAPKASSTLPSAVQWIGVRRPTQLPDDTTCRPPACATVSASPAATTASVTVSPVSAASRSISRLGDRRELAAHERDAAEARDLGPEPHEVAVGAFEEAARAQRRHQPRRRAAVDAEPVGDLGDAQRVRRRVELLEHLERPVGGLQRHLALCICCTERYHTARSCVLPQASLAEGHAAADPRGRPRSSSGARPGRRRRSSCGECSGPTAWRRSWARCSTG